MRAGCLDSREIFVLRSFLGGGLSAFQVRSIIFVLLHAISFVVLCSVVLLCKMLCVAAVLRGIILRKHGQRSATTTSNSFTACDADRVVAEACQRIRDSVAIKAKVFPQETCGKWLRMGRVEYEVGVL